MRASLKCLSGCTFDNNKGAVRQSVFFQPDINKSKTFNWDESLRNAQLVLNSYVP